ncbi:MAG: NAD(P)H-dependent oxidoreductase subunit E [Actinomycetota bacterium]
MARLTAANVLLAREIIARYPRPKSALIPLLHLAQQQDGYVADDAMEHLAELVGITPAEVLGTCSFYEMFKREPVGRYMINICTNIACQLNGGEELLHHAEESLGIRPGGTTEDGMFTLEDVECIAACTEAPCLQVNYRYKLRLTTDDLDELIDDIRNGRTADIPEHGTLGLTRQHIPAGAGAGIFPPEQASERPVWLARNDVADGGEETGGA